MENLQKLIGELEKQYKKEFIFIPTNTPSLKNSKVWTGRRLIPSKTVREYIKSSAKDYESNKKIWDRLIKDQDKPYKVGFHFIRKSRHKFDFINACQIVQDLMVEHKWIDDDNMDELIPFCVLHRSTEDPDFSIVSGYTYDKDNPGVLITVL